MTISEYFIIFIFCAMDHYQGNNGDNIMECYYCIDECDIPLNTLICQALDNNVSCYSSISTAEDGTTDQIKGCAIDADTDFADWCATINEEGGNCYTCQENLCNDANK